MKPCWILTHAKTGSTYLCRLLNSTGLFDPVFREHYQEPNTTPVPAVPPAYCKLMHSQYTWHRKKKTMLFEFYPKMRFVYLRRRDVVASTVSWFFHNETQTYNLSDPGKLEMYQQFHLKYDTKKMYAAYIRKTWEYHFWDEMVRKLGDTCIETYYEDIIADPQGEVTKIMNHIGVERPWNINFTDKSLTIKLSHPQKQKFTNRLRRQLAGRGVLARPQDPLSKP